MDHSERRLDHWRASLDVVEALRERLDRGPQAVDDPEVRVLMAQVLHAKSSSFIVLLGPDGHVLDVNPAALIAGGVDRAEVIGMPLWSTAWWSSAGAETVGTVKHAVASAAAGRFARFDIEIAIEGRRQADSTLDLAFRPLRGRDGRVAFIVAEGRTITDRKRVEQRLARQNAELSALTERLARVHDYRERLLGELSHDLRTPLRVVVTRAEQVLHGGLDPHLHAHIAGIRLAALDALEQINEMLEQVKADHGETRLTLVDADLADAVRTVSDQFAALAADRDIRLRLEIEDRVAARFDVERVSRIVSNLLANGIRHAPAGGVVRCSLTAREDAAVLAIADSGPGVPEEHRDRVFGRFRSGLAGDGRSTGAGAGLGLAIVREFVELHGGDISLSEAPEGGALFEVTLPRRPPAGRPVAATLAQHAAAAQRTEYVRSRLEADLAGTSPDAFVNTILVVERVASRAQVIVGGIGEDAVPCLAGDAIEALRLAYELRPDTVVVGTSVGDMPQTSLLRRLAGDPELPGLQIVALAGEREEDASPEALREAGAHVVMPVAAAEEVGRRLRREDAATRR